MACNSIYVFDYKVLFAFIYKILFSLKVRKCLPPWLRANMVYLATYQNYT